MRHVLTPVPSIGSMKGLYEKRRSMSHHVTFPTYTILSKVHVCCKDVRASTMLPQFSNTPREKGWTHHCFTEELFLQRALATRVVLQRDIPICAESSGEYSDVATHRFSAANVCVRWEFNKSDKTYKGLSRMLDNLYSKFCAATAFSSTRSKKEEFVPS
jgi:hypothetical protein